MNGIAQITLNGQVVKLKFGLPALRLLSERIEKLNLFEDTGAPNELGIMHILYSAYENECIRTDQPRTIPFESFYEYVEETTEESRKEIKDAIISFEQSKHVTDIVSVWKKKEQEKTKKRRK